MQRLFLLLFSFSLPTYLIGQHKVKFILQEKTEIKHDSIYIVGTFNGWDSLSNPQYLMRSIDNHTKEIELHLDSGSIAYKFHRGDWLKVEKSFFGGEIRDRIVNINQDTVLIDSVVGWRDELILDKKIALEKSEEIERQVYMLAGIASNYAFNQEYYDLDSAFHYAQEAINLQQRIVDNTKSPRMGREVRLLSRLKEIVASLMHSLGNYSKSLELRLQIVALIESDGDSLLLAIALNNLMTDFMAIKDYPVALEYGHKAISLLDNESNRKLRTKRLYLRSYNQIALANFNSGALDTALSYALKSKDLLSEQSNIVDIIYSNLLLADIYSAKGAYQKALDYYEFVIKEVPTYAPQFAARAQAGLAQIYGRKEQLDLALSHARKAFDYYQNSPVEVQSWGENSAAYVAEISPILADLYRKRGDLDDAYEMLELSINLKDSLYNTDRIRQFQTLAFNDAARRNEINRQKEIAEQELQTKIKLYALLFGIIGALFLAIILFRNNKQKQRDNSLLKAQKSEIEQTLKELKSVQAQLIHSEKMASLGELTAGIAHEIQNPLNFVNNFSEVSAELLMDANDELDQGSIVEAKELLQDLRRNLEKINHHGDRASSIVKGMLDHSRSTPGEKIPTDINQLCDEYLRLAYHGMRAKDKSFNVKYETHFQEDLPMIYLEPQEIGRVILNIVNNAFQALQSVALAKDSAVSSDVSFEALAKKDLSTEALAKGEASAKKDLSTEALAKGEASAKEDVSSDLSTEALAKGEALAKEDVSSVALAKEDQAKVKTENEDYQPLVRISSKYVSPAAEMKEYIQITIWDNGPGIPDEIKDKIFQPFFTTKAAGQGTGLGLSLSYDIIKAHGGNISVKSDTGNGTIFTLELPTRSKENKK